MDVCPPTTSVFPPAIEQRPKAPTWVTPPWSMFMPPMVVSMTPPMTCVIGATTVALAAAAVVMMVPVI